MGAEDDHITALTIHHRIKDFLKYIGYPGLTMTLETRSAHAGPILSPTCRQKSSRRFAQSQPSAIRLSSSANSFGVLPMLTPACGIHGAEGLVGAMEDRRLRIVLLSEIHGKISHLLLVVRCISYRILAISGIIIFLPPNSQ